MVTMKFLELRRGRASEIINLNQIKRIHIGDYYFENKYHNYLYIEEDNRNVQLRIDDIENDVNLEDFRDKLSAFLNNDKGCFQVFCEYA